MKKKEFIKELKKHQKLSKGQKGILSLYGNVLLIRTGENSCELSSTDLSIMLKTVCNDIQGVIFDKYIDSVLFDPEIAIKMLSKDDIYFKVKDDKLYLNNRVELNYISKDIFPVFPEFNKTDNCVHVELSTLKRFANYVGNDCTNKMYSGFNFQYNKETENVVLAVTDAKLIIKDDNISSAIATYGEEEPNLNITIPHQIHKYLDEENVVIMHDEKRAYIQDGNTQLITNLYEGKYPVYQVVYKKMHKNTYSFYKHELSAFLELLHKDTEFILFDFSESGFCSLKAQLPDYSYVNAKIQCHIEKNDYDVDIVDKIGLGKARLKKILKCSYSDEIKVIMNIGGCCEPVHFNIDNIVIMPMRVE